MFALRQATNCAELAVQKIASFNENNWKTQIVW